MGDIEDLKQAIQRDFIAPLSEFRTQTQALDTTHDQCVKAFQDAIGSLFGPGSSFSGAAADALAELTGNYLAAEQAIGDYASNSLSERLAQAATACDQAVASMEPILASLHDWPGAQAAGAVITQDMNIAEQDGGPPEPGNPLWDIIIAGGLVVAGGAFVWEQGQQQMNVNTLWQDIQQWQGAMKNIAQQLESKLPPAASDPQPFVPKLSDLSPAQQRQVRDILQWLNANGVYADQSDVENLVKLGYDRDTIIQILLAGIPTTILTKDINARLADLHDS